MWVRIWKKANENRIRILHAVADNTRYYVWSTCFAFGTLLVVFVVNHFLPSAQVAVPLLVLVLQVTTTAVLFLLW